MELGKRLKEYRNQSGMTQDDLAERLYVTRQTISAWENDKSYPDIHSLLMLGDLFHVSLDTLVKGDIEIMKETIDQADIRNFKRDSNIYAILLPTVDYKTCATVIERIEQLFYQEYPSGNITFHARFSPMGGK